MFDFIGTILPIASFIASAIAIYFTIRKHGYEAENLDADTISKLHNTIREQEKRYDESVLKAEARYEKMRTEFETYKEVMNTQIAYLQGEAARWRSWADKLCKQLKDNGIQPENF